MYYNFNHKLIKPEIYECIRLSTNKFINSKTYSKYFCDNNDKPNFFFLFPIVSLISFLAGYNFHKLTI